MRTLTILFFSFLGLGLGIIVLAPNFLNVACGCGSESKMMIGTLNKAQQAYFIENQKLPNSVKELINYAGIGNLINQEKNKYQYLIRITDKSAFNYAISKDSSKRPNYVGAVFVVPAIDINRQAHPNEKTTVNIICIANLGDTNEIAEPAYNKKIASCGLNTKKLGE